MNIDERIEALTARHEALTMNLELLSRDREADKEESKRRWASNDKLMREIMEGTARLLHTAEIHEHRINQLEGGEA